MNVKLNIHNGVVEEEPKEFQIIFNISGKEISLWLESDMSDKDFVATILNFLSKVVLGIL